MDITISNVVNDLDQEKESVSVTPNGQTTTYIKTEKLNKSNPKSKGKPKFKRRNTNKTKNKDGIKIVPIKTGSDLKALFPSTVTAINNDSVSISMFSVMKLEFRLFNTGVLTPLRLNGYLKQFVTRFLSGYQIDDLDLSEVISYMYELLEASYEAYALVLHLIRSYSCSKIRLPHSGKSISEAFCTTIDWSKRNIPSVVDLNERVEYSAHFNVEKLSMEKLNTDIYPLFQSFYLSPDAINHCTFLFGYYHKLVPNSSGTVYLDCHTPYSKGYKSIISRLEDLSDRAKTILGKYSFIPFIFDSLGIKRCYRFIKDFKPDLSGSKIYIREDDGSVSNAAYNWMRQWMSHYDEHPNYETGINPDPEIYGQSARTEISPLSFSGITLQTQLIQVGSKMKAIIDQTKAGDERHECMLKLRNFMENDRSKRFTIEYSIGFTQIVESEDCNRVLMEDEDVGEILTDVISIWDNSFRTADERIHSLTSDITQDELVSLLDEMEIAYGRNFLPLVTAIAGAAYNSYRFYSENRANFRRAAEYAKRAFKTPQSAQDKYTFQPKEDETRTEFVERVRSEYNYEFKQISSFNTTVYSRKYVTKPVISPLQFMYKTTFPVNMDEFMFMDLFRMLRPYCNASIHVGKSGTKFQSTVTQVSIPGFIHKGLSFDNPSEAHKFTRNQFLNTLVTFPTMFFSNYWPSSDGSGLCTCTPPGINNTIFVNEDFQTLSIHDHEYLREIVRSSIFFNNFEKKILY